MRPVVNEYIEMLRNILKFAEYTNIKPGRNYKAKITHDIDFFARYDTFFKFGKAFTGDKKIWLAKYGINIGYWCS